MLFVNLHIAPFEPRNCISSFVQANVPGLAITPLPMIYIRSTKNFQVRWRFNPFLS